MPTTYGPFYPSSVASSPNGGTPWASPGNAAGLPNGSKTTCNLGSSEGASDLLVATEYSASVPQNATVRRVRFAVDPEGAITGAFNPSTKDMIGAGGPVELSQNAGTLRAEDDIAPTPAQINSSGFGLSLSVYGQSGGTVEVESLALFVDVD